jgi:hypothetical protein
MTISAEKIKMIRDEFKDISPVLDERRIRVWAAARAKAYNREYGHGGVMAVHKATGISRPRIYAGLRELESPTKMSIDRIRCPGGGRKKTKRHIPMSLPD